MAATQQVPAAVLSDENKATFEQLTAASKDKKVLDAKDEVITHGFIVNRHKNNVSLQILDQHNWSGNPVPSYPQTIVVSQDPIEFKHHGPLPEGSKGGVVYADGVDSTTRKWLVAFDLLKKKVYVEAGPIGPVDWNVIEVRLDASGNSSVSVDPVFGGRAEAGNNGDIVVAWFSN
ncbi:jasmonate-induced protein homolog [Chenopodium quinoa]|uniref:jasmonate-induced protein homolog n=1 Tax=Chenopodium quinoa TaxID=63459 RepID=UPI000B791CB9|nr:jasmonate-induced protein homolog [Chenopodium quinoa]